MLRFLFHPLVPADRGNPKNFKFVRLQKNQNTMTLIFSCAAAGIPPSAIRAKNSSLK